MNVGMNANRLGVRRWSAVLFLSIWIYAGYGSPFGVQASGSILSSKQGQEIPRFDPTPCMVDLPAGLVEGQDVTCGYLVVPEEYANPSGDTIQLAVVILHSKDLTPEADPLILLQGGPGGSTIDTYLQALPTNERIWSDRDIVMFDQRGTLYSRPALNCPEFMDLIIQTLDKDLSDEEDFRLSLGTIEACQKRLENQGINLNAFDSIENANDVESLRKALGYDLVNLYGVSYGSLLAQQVMRLFPEGIRSVILDGVVPPQVNFILEAPRTINRSFEELFAACAQDAECNGAYPDLREIFYQQVDRLNEKPVTIHLTDSETGKTYPALLDGDSFMSGIFQMAYATELIPYLPRIIYDSREENFSFFSRIESLFIFDRSLLHGMYYSVECAEDADFSPEDYDLSGLPKQIQEMEKNSASFFSQACKVWDVEPLSNQVDQPVNRNIPTLILSGRFDPITPPEYGELVAKGLPNAYPYTFLDGGHGAALSGECQDQIILDFLANPSTPPEAACISAKKGPEFVTPGSLVRLPVLGEMLSLGGDIIWQAGLYLLAMLFLLTALFVYPLVWLVRFISHKPARAETNPPAETVIGMEGATAQARNITKPGRGLYRFAPWIAFTTALVLLIFTTVFFSVVVSMVAKNDIRMLMGLPGGTRPLFLLPVLAAVLAIVMVVAAIIGWVRRSGSFAGRLYFSMLTCAALVCVFILTDWGMLITSVIPG